MAKKNIISEDEIRDKARDILGLGNTESAISDIRITAKEGVGQLTTFYSLLGLKDEDGKGISDKPDGWYFPNLRSFPAIILETKNSGESVTNHKLIDELKKNIEITHKLYKDVIGILYNGSDVYVLKNDEYLENETELKNKEYYLGLFSVNNIDTEKIYNLTRRINNTLHFKFTVNSLKHRMIFTSCALVAKRFGATFQLNKGLNAFKSSITNTFDDICNDEGSVYTEAEKDKFKMLKETFDNIEFGKKQPSQEDINDFINWISEISDNINSDFWNGEDVMAIFFSEFNRYKGKSEQGQVFTPDHITSLMYRLIEVNKDSKVLDATCGSGSFLVKAMCNMIKECGGGRNSKTKEIKKCQLYGIELDKVLYALACANMLIHKDGKTNIEQKDASSPDASKWISSKDINKVLMNPPFENKYGCLDIVENVLDSVTKYSQCAFILPDFKLQKNKPKALQILRKHRLEKIVKLPVETFSEGVETSIFIFRANERNNNLERPIIGWYIEDDGLVTVKNQGRQDKKKQWKEIENLWVDVIVNSNDDRDINKTKQRFYPTERLYYKTKDSSFSISDIDFKKVVLNYALYKKNILEADFKQAIIDYNLYGKSIPSNLSISNACAESKSISITPDDWKPYKLSDIFKKPERSSERQFIDYDAGDTPFISSGNYNNGIQDYVKPKEVDGILEKLDEGNCITISPVDGSAFYQESAFLGRGGGGSSIIILRLNENQNSNKYIGLFLCAVIRKCLNKYEFKDMASSSTILDDEIYLPVVNDKVDWALMTNYIKSLPYSVNI